MDVDTFFREQDSRMNISDDDMEEYRSRMSKKSQRQRVDLPAISQPEIVQREAVETDKTRQEISTDPVDAAPSESLSSSKRKRHTSRTPATPRKRNKPSDGADLTSLANKASKNVSMPYSCDPAQVDSETEDEPVTPPRRSTRLVLSPKPPASSSPRARPSATKGSRKSTNSLRTAKPPEQAPHVPVTPPQQRSSSPPHRDTSPIEDASEFSEQSVRAGKETPSFLLQLRERVSFIEKDKASKQNSKKAGKKIMKLSSSKGMNSSPAGSAIETSSPPTAPKTPSSWELKFPNEKRDKLPPGKYYYDEYADKLNADAKAGLIKPRKPQTLIGANIYFCGGDNLYLTESSRKKMEIIVKLGGTLAPIFDPEIVSYIVDDAPAPPVLLRYLRLKRLKDIPDHIPTVKWEWVNCGNPLTVEPWNYAKHVSRFDAGCKPTTTTTTRRGKGKAKALAQEDSADFSRIGEFTDDNIQPPSGSNTGGSKVQNARSVKLGASSSRVPLNFEPEVKVKTETPEDPLAEFYEQALADMNEEIGRYGEAEETDDSSSEEEDNSAPAKRQRALQELSDLHRAKPTQDDRWRVLSYTKAISSLKVYPQRIKSLRQAKMLNGVGEKTAMKIMEIIETGNLRRIQHERTEAVQVAQIFQGIYGVGASTALKWYQNGCRTLDDLKDGKAGVKLSRAQKIGLQFYDDINERMPREEAAAIFDLIKPIGVLSRLLKKLHAAKIITEDLALPEPDPEEGDLEAIYRGLCHLPGKEGAKRRRIDFLTVPWKSKGAALLYYTGDDLFNRSMRYKANKMGYSLNQRGLYEGVVRDPHNRTIKTNKGNILASEAEEDIFRILQVPWQEPHERVRDRRKV
ncbi:hypothetical protein VNI00_007597 [Paramarasmius palmivorus]|uniref:DNA-directed DNA polymerase n=1 Tax=Paramarasmius palmivorus TaxID=297713 RepID=A0AAW0D3N7_9AGAR